MCLVPPAGPSVTAMTEPRGVAKRERTLVPRSYLFKTEVGQVGNSGVRALTLVSIYVFDILVG
jgi:hypothetical protein